MNNKFTIDQPSKSETIDPNSINRLYKINKMLDFMAIRSNDPRMTQKQICKELKISDSSIKRIRNEIEMDSPYRRNDNKKKKPNQTPDTTTETIKSVTNKKSKNNVIKGGNVYDIHTISGKELIDQTFQDDKANSILENKPEDNKKLITIARRMIDNK